LIDGGFGDEGAVGKARVVEQTLEWRESDGSLTDVLMAVEPGAARCLRIICATRNSSSASSMALFRTSISITPKFQVAR
jgi:hypothetical protein